MNVLQATELALKGERMTAPHLQDRYIVSYDGNNIRSEWPSGTGNLWTPGAEDRRDDWTYYKEPEKDKWGFYQD